jgi:hypothetical protein
MKKATWGVLLFTFLGLLIPAQLHAQSALEIPAPGSAVSGLGFVAGWKCSAGKLTYSVDNGPAAELVYGVSRGDVEGTCGHNHTGFIAEQNWNLTGDGQHTIRLFDDGQQFAGATFTVTTLGQEFVSGASATCNTTIVNKTVTLSWQESQQNFAITGAGSYPHVAGQWGVSLDFTAEDCNFLSVPPDLPTHLSGAIQVSQNGPDLTVLSNVVTLTGTLKTNGDFTVVAVPQTSTASTCTYALTSSYSGNFPDHTVSFVILAVT